MNREEPTIQEKLEELMRQELKDVKFHPATPGISDNSSSGSNSEEDRFSEYNS